MRSKKDKHGNRDASSKEIDRFLAPFEDAETDGEAKDGSVASSRRERRARRKAAKRSAKTEAGASSGKPSRVRRLFFGDGSQTLKERLFLKDNPNYDPALGATAIIKGKTVKNKPKKVSVLKLVRDAAVLLALFVLIFLIYAFVVISMAPKIDPENIYDSVAQSSVIYDDSGTKIDTIYYSQDRQIISYDQMPENLVNAFVAIEDKTFWDHNGFNWTRMIGAVFQSITGSGRISGTSTITQQLARNVYLSDIKSQRSIRRKIIEMYYASQIERSLSKEEIMEAYLNSIYLGFGSYGVYSASHAYFSVDPADMTLEQCAALAALPQAPDSYALVKLASDDSVTEGTTNIILRDPDTYIANDVSKDRRNTCLELMLEQEYITQEQYDAAYDKDLIDFIKPTVSSNTNVNSYFKEYMIDEVKDDLMDEYDLSDAEAEQMIYTGGLKIYSTLDSTAQSVIVQEFEDSSNFPYLVGINKDSSGNIIDSSGNIMLYDYNDAFSNGVFTIAADECQIHEDGSVTILRGKRLSIYTTESGGVTDYSLEFKKLYVQEDGTLYIYSGGYINIPAEYKSLDDDGNLVIDATYFQDYPDAMSIGEDTVAIQPDGYSLNQKTIQPQAAMVIVEVGTGEIKAMVGGRSQTGSQLYNRAINPRQPGSSIKPLAVYSAALQKSFEYAENGEKWPYVDYGHDSQGTKYFGDYLTASSTIIDEPMTFNGKSWPKNSSNSYSGAVTMRKGLQQSINTVAVKIQLQVGNDYSLSMLEKYGLSTIVTGGTTNDENSAALALGGLTNGAIPLEMAEAYATFPNGGVRQSSISYTKVEDRDGESILTSKSKSTKVLDEGVAFIMTDMLKSVVSNGIGSPAATYSVQSGGKTGTTSDSYDIWFDGFTPTYAAALWIGTDVNIELSSMSSMSAALWGNIMNQIPNALTGSYPSQPDNVVYVGGEYYTKGTETGRSSYQGSSNDEDDDDDEEESSSGNSSGSGSSGGSSGTVTPATPSTPSGGGDGGDDNNNGGSGGDNNNNNNNNNNNSGNTSSNSGTSRRNTNRKND